MMTRRRMHFTTSTNTRKKSKEISKLNRSYKDGSNQPKTTFFKFLEFELGISKIIWKYKSSWMIISLLFNQSILLSDIIKSTHSQA